MHVMMMISFVKPTIRVLDYFKKQSITLIVGLICRNPAGLA